MVRYQHFVSSNIFRLSNFLQILKKDGAVHAMTQCNMHSYSFKLNIIRKADHKMSADEIFLAYPHHWFVWF